MLKFVSEPGDPDPSQAVFNAHCHFVPRSFCVLAYDSAHAAPVRCSLRDLGPLALREVRYAADEQLVNGLVHQYVPARPPC
jgi:hypothetical protein